VDLLGEVRTTRVVLATAHRNHDTSDNTAGNLAALCQRCHMLHDRSEHQRRRWRTLFGRKAMGDLFRGPYST
jgi:cytochrome c553